MIGKKRVLLVDDNLKLAAFIQLGLKYGGFEVFIAETGQKALDASKTSEFDVMLLDIRLPDIYGFEVIRRLREFSQLPVIAYSATPEYSSQALEAGANAFIPKPFEMEQLIEAINKLTNCQG